METGQDHDTPEVSEMTKPSIDTATSRVTSSAVDLDTGTERKLLIYRQDVVRCKNSGKIGMVTEVAGDSDSDSDSSITDDEDEDDDENEKTSNDEEGVDDDGDSNDSDDENKDDSNYKSSHLAADQVRVIWMDESETIQNVKDVELVDRGFLHGDYVASASDPTGQVGSVVDINISVDLMTGDGSVIADVSSRNLKRVRDFAVGDYVAHGPWLGRIDDILDNVTVMFGDGSVCKVLRADPLSLQPVGKNNLDDVHFPYYPGQQVKANSSSVFKNSRWLSGLWRANRLEGTVTKVTVGSVFIYWIASAGYGPDSSTTPAEEQSPKDLKLLSCFLHATWQLGDWCLLPTNTRSSSTALSESLSNLRLHETVHHQTRQESDPDILAPEKLDDNAELMDCDADTSLNGNDGNIDSNLSAESGSCSSPLSASKDHVREIWPLHRKKIRKVVRRDKKARKKEVNFEKALLIVKTTTRVDVIWQDGTKECGLVSKNLISIESPGDHDFVAEQYVVEKAGDESDVAGAIARVGIVKSVNAKDKTTCVRWLKSVSRAEDPKEFAGDEIVSVYELEGHPDYDYCYGDVVVRLSPVSVLEEMPSLEGFTEKSKQYNSSSEVNQDTEKNLRSTPLEGAFSDEVVTGFSELSWVGNITGLRDGDIEVTWADGMITTVGPQAIYVVGRDEDDDSVAAGSDVSDDAASWETVQDDEREVLENGQEDLETPDGSDGSSEVDETRISAENSGRNGALSFPQAAFGFMSRLASGIFSRGHKHVDLLNSDARDDQVQEIINSVNIDHGNEPGSQQPDGTTNDCDIVISHGEVEEHVETKETDLLEVTEALCSSKPKESNALSSDADACTFKRFDIAKDPYDHYYIGADGQGHAGRKWLKKVQQDWNILQNNLPDTIYVRVYEDRMDLMRAVIIGAYGTPYQDGIYFFDFHLPPDYPNVPPSAYYRSGGWRINPNLYEEGKVCLSLLNTWTGRGNEVWDPASSSILQVLVSLQGLVLNSKPYFNEAGYDKQIGTAEGEKNSLSYNENTFLLSCKTMMYLMRTPPKDFEVLVKEHFKKRGHYILKACDAYMKGYLIASLTEDASLSDKSIPDANSVGFKLMLAKIVPKLFLALTEVGACCDEFKHLLPS
ncbi:putative ubiquitin-conjugating enzyme E2 23 [Heracleum sosnowskyi]|uniref:E2 ubiquitin-conjugating enzyme n=1 Tax=Heracleum sosnowskyi TaxID=360622 RepID=A0AAD8MXM8_9APIA|nr:putative ubiquitin-conjugating enzyme E2 23 [Heracleum sosnowskyi]